MKYADMTTRERLELEAARDMLDKIAEQISDMIGNPNYDADLWELRTKIQSEAAAFYNIYYGIYRGKKVQCRKIEAEIAEEVRP